MIGDILEGKITPEVGNAACNAGSRLLKVIEMNYRYGKEKPDAPRYFSIGSKSSGGKAVKK